MLPGQTSREWSRPEGIYAHLALLALSAGLFCLALCWPALVGCSQPPPRVPVPARPLSHAHALQVIARVYKLEGQEPTGGEPLDLGGDRSLRVDAWAKGRTFGVAYVSRKEWEHLGSALPPRDPTMGDALQLVGGLGRQASARILVLYDSDYMYNELQGQAPTSNSIAAEKKLERDVRDFLARARAEGWQ